MQILRKETEQQRKRIENDAFEIAQNATAQRSLLLLKASAEAKAIRDHAQNQGLQIIYDKLKITEERHKNSLDYIRTLHHKQAKKYVGFPKIILLMKKNGSKSLGKKKIDSFVFDQKVNTIATVDENLFQRNIQ